MPSQVNNQIEYKGTRKYILNKACTKY